MEEYLGSLSVPAITAAVYFIIKIIRHAVGKNVKFEKFVPLIAAGLGVSFAVICFFALPAIIPSENVVVAIVIGGASGLTAIGTDQMIKQFGKKSDESDKTSDTGKSVPTENSEETQKESESQSPENNDKN